MTNLHENRHAYPNRIPNKPPSSMASAKRVGMILLLQIKVLWQLGGQCIFIHGNKEYPGKTVEDSAPYHFLSTSTS